MIRHKCVQSAYAWHLWWAWYPVRIHDKKSPEGRVCWTFVWGDYVWRRMGSGEDWWEYALSDPRIVLGVVLENG